MRWINGILIFFCLLTATFIGAGLAVKEMPRTEVPSVARSQVARRVMRQTESLEIESATLGLTQLSGAIVDIQELVVHIHEVTHAYQSEFKLQTEVLETQIDRSYTQQKLSDDIYEKRITRVLGEPLSTYLSPQVEIKLFELKELGYRGYMAKVKMFDPVAFKVVLGEDTPGGLETTSSMAQRHKAMLAVNGGGFGTFIEGGKQYAAMTGATVMDSFVVQSFLKTAEPIFFVGINGQGKVVGTLPETQDDIEALEAKQGVSFLPILILNGKRQKIPSAWAETRHPRTVLGRYANDDLLLIVIDGRQSYWSNGVTLEHLQEKLQYLGVQDAYNLDGGGSSTIYYNGMVLNRPSDGTERPVANAILIMP